jgi:hypothetical protein
VHQPTLGILERRALPFQYAAITRSVSGKASAADAMPRETPAELCRPVDAPTV